MKKLQAVLVVTMLLLMTGYGQSQNTEEGGAIGYKTRNLGEQERENTEIAPVLRDEPATIIAKDSSCNPVEYGGSAPFLTAVAPLNGFYVIQGAAEWLPPLPGSSGNGTIAGIDADGDCIRDDIEHYIARKFNQQSQQKLRKYLFEYTVWMNHFLTLDISVDAAKTSSNNMAAAGECVDQILGNHTETKTVLDDLFAQFHNTFPRSNRYIDNLSQLGGWTTRETITVSCP